MTDFGIHSDELRRLAKLVEENGLSELRYEEGDLRITLRTASFYRQNTTIAPVLAPAPVVPLPDWEVVADEPEAETPEAEGIPIEAPIMGVFYRSASPDDPVFVEVGDEVEVGQTIGLIEAMKVFSEVQAEVAGRVLAIVATNKALVHPGDTLILLEGNEA